MTHSFPTRRSSDLITRLRDCRRQNRSGQLLCVIACNPDAVITCDLAAMHTAKFAQFDVAGWNSLAGANDDGPAFGRFDRSEEHTSELQSLMRISYAVFCLKKKKKMKIIYNI